MNPAIGQDPESIRLRERVAQLEREVAARKRAAQWLQARDAATSVLVTSSSFAEAGPQLLQGIGEALGWQIGALWKVESRWNVLRCVASWRAPSPNPSEFFEATKRRTFPKGVGLPGRVWESGKPEWIDNAPIDANFPRAELARQEGLQRGLAFPVLQDSEVLAILEFFTTEPEALDEDLLQTFHVLGYQIGQFLKRARADETVDRFFTSSLDLLCIAGFDGVFRRLNPAWERTLGYSLEELMTQPFLDFIHPEDQGATLDEMEKLTAGAHLTVAFENRYRTKSGEYRWLSWTAAPFTSDQLIYAVARDMTERRQIEEQLRSLRVAAEAASAAKSEFLARMSHEIRTPMNAIIGMADLLWDSPLSPEQREYVRIFRRAGGNLLDLINDILDLSKIESGNVEIAASEFEISDVVERSVEITAVQAHEKGLELISCVMPDVPPDLIGDALRLRQVLVNLLGNAVKFTGHGEVVLHVEREPASPGASARLRISVSDTGPGIPADKQKMIFESFTQADASTTRTHGGTGLGLAISKRLVGLMGGELSLTSEPGRGSTFYFTLDLPISNKPHRGTDAPVADLKGMNTLIVDDNATNRMILRQMLVSWGAEVHEANDGEDAIKELTRAYAVRRPYELVLLDCRMPGVDGFGVAEHIHSHGVLAGVVVLMLTSDNRAGDAARSRAMGVQSYLVKPVRRPELLEAIRNALGCRAEPQQTPVPTADGHTDETASAPLRILLAEDSEDNVFLIRSYLNDSSYQLEYACNGEEAVRKFQSQDFDLVLMDMQMPVLDGYGAAKQIREWEMQHSRQPVPVLALTAYALAEEEARSINAGCTAHLSKPIRQQTLLAAIRRHTEIEVRVSAKLRDILPGYLERQGVAAKTLHELLATGNFDEIRVLGHRMKGSGAGYGLDKITEIGAAIEKAASQREAAAVHECIRRLESFLARVTVFYE